MGILMGGFAGRWYAPPPLDPEVEAEIRSKYMLLRSNLETQQAQYSTQSLATHGQLLVNARQSQANFYSVYANLMQTDAANRNAYSGYLNSVSQVLERDLMDAYGNVSEGLATAMSTTAVGMGETTRNALANPTASKADQIGKRLDAPFDFGIFIAKQNQGNVRNNLNQIISSERAQGNPTIDASIAAEVALRNEMRSAALATEDALEMPRGTLSSPQALNTAMFSAGYSIPNGGSVMIGGNAMTQDEFLLQYGSGLDASELTRMKQPLIPALIHEARNAGESVELRQKRFVDSNERLAELRQRMEQGPATTEKAAVISAIKQLQGDIDEMNTDPTYMGRRLGEMPMLGGIQDMQAQIDSQIEYLSMSRDPVEQKINQLYGEFGSEFMKSYAMVAFDGALRQPSVEDVMLDLQTQEGQERLVMAHQLYNNAPNLYANDPHLFWNRLQQNGVPVNAIQRKTGITPRAIDNVQENAANLSEDSLLGTDENVRRNGQLMPSAYHAALPALRESLAEPAVPAPDVALEPEVPAAPAAPVDYLADEVEGADVGIPTGIREGMPEWYPQMNEAHTLDIGGENYVLDSDGGLSVIEEDGHPETISPTEDSALYGQIHHKFESAAAEGQFAYQPPQSVEEVGQRIREGESFTSQEVAAARGEAPAEEVAVDMPQVEATREELMGLDPAAPRETLRERRDARLAGKEEREADPLLERALAAAKRTAEKLRTPKFEAPTKMRYQPAEEAMVKPPKPKKRKAAERPARRPVRPKEDAAPVRTKDPGTKPDAAAEHEERVEGIVSEQTAEVEAEVARTDLPGSDDSPGGRKVSVKDAARRTLPSESTRPPSGGQSGMYGRSE